MSKFRARTLGAIILIVLLVISTTVLAAPYGSRTLYTGTFGGDVLELQRRLADLGYNIGTPDGIYAGRTRTAVMQFQYDYGLVVDGLANKWTMRAVDRAFTWHNGSFYTVQPGDSVYTIATKGGTTVDQLIWLNQLQDTMIIPGQQLRVPWKSSTATPDPKPLPPAVNPAPRPEYIPTPEQSPAPGPTPATPSVPAPVQPANPSQPVAAGKTVLGYYTEDWIGDRSSLNSLQGAAGQVNLVVNFQLQIDAFGNVATRSYPELMALAQAKGLQVQALVHNFSGDSFDAFTARSVLSDPGLRARAVENLYMVVKANGLSGLNVDIENVPPSQRDNYTAFVRELAGRLKPDGLRLTLSIPAKTTDERTSAWGGAFDYKALGQYADQIIPMTYDEHLPGFPAGPIASSGWVEQVIRYAVSQIPPEKVLLGIAGYAYDWRTGTVVGRGLGASQAMSLAARYSAPIQWDPVAQVPYFTYVADGVSHTVYFENAQSTAPKLDLVKKYGLGGVAVWRLGLEDPAIWPLIADKLR